MGEKRIKSDPTGFEINGIKYTVGDVIDYGDPFTEGIIQFGFYDNKEIDDCGCGFYVTNFKYVGGKWIPDKNSIIGITPYFEGKMETDFQTIRKIREAYNKYIAKNKQDRLSVGTKQFNKIKNYIASIEDTFELVGFLDGIIDAAGLWCSSNCPNEVSFYESGKLKNITANGMFNYLESDVDEVK